MSHFEMQCPECGRDDRLEVLTKRWALIVGEETVEDEALDCSNEWDSGSPCKCLACDWHGSVEAAQDTYSDN